MSTRTERLHRQAKLDELSAVQHGVVSRGQLYAAGINRWQVRAELAARRWRRHGKQTIALHTGPLDCTAVMWRAIFETGADAALDGVSALLIRGLQHFRTDTVHISVSKGSRYRRTSGVRVHETRRRRPADVVDLRFPVVRPEVAAIRGALWARTDRQAAYILILSVQQGLTLPAALCDAFRTVRRDKRRMFIRRLLADLTDGVRSMGELDLEAALRRRGLPPPTRQALRRTSDGRAYLDVYWDQFNVVVEVEGIHHLLPGVAVADSLRQNRLTIDSDSVLRIPVLGLRIAQDDFLDQVEELLRRNGWQGTARSDLPTGRRLTA